MTYVPRFGTCGFCGHFVDQHQGESFRVLEGPDDDRGWRYRCSCGCRIKYVIGADGGKGARLGRGRGMTDSWVDLLGREDVVLAAERESLAAVTTWTLGKPCASCSLRGWLHWGDTPHLVESDTQEANNMTAVPAFGTRAHLLSVMDPWEDPESMVIALEEAGYAIVPVVQVTCEECGSRVEDPFTHRQWHFSWRKRMTELLDRKSGR